MFRSFIDHTQMTVSAMVSKYIGRIIVVALFTIAAGFGLAAIAVKLIEAFGPMAAYALLAGVFAVIGVVATLMVAVNERHQQTLLQRTGYDRTALVSTLAAAAPVVLAQGASLLGRRTPIFLMALLLAGLFMRNSGVRSTGVDR